MPEDTLPPYDSAINPPSYSSAPLTDERTLALTPRPGLVGRQSSSLVKCFKEAVIIFTDQAEPNTGSPTYDRGATIGGEIGLTCPESILEVSVKFYGQTNLMAADWGSTGSTLVSDKQTLWSARDARVHCPSIIPFAIRIPSTYTSPEGKTMRMPPSFEASLFGIPAFFAKCIYTLSITIVTTRRYGFASWTASKTFNIPLNYRPRTRPQRPIVVFDTVFSSLKPVPEEWRQVMATMETRLGSPGKPIHCHLLIPSVQTFAIADPIPFHIQLCGPLMTLHELVPPHSDLLKPNHKAPISKDSYPNSLPPPDADGVRVRIVRQIVAEINGRTRIRTLTIGRAEIHPVPPAITDVHLPDEICIDWQGEAKCFDSVTCGGFNAHGLLVKDYLVLDLTPPRPSFLLPLQISQPIRLVTDSWTDTETIHPQDL